MLAEFIKALGLIFIAEMGDKTQILAMAFATRFKVKSVLLGIFLGSLFNHGLAVILGSYLSTLIPISTIQMLAGIAFVGFALWTLQMDDDEEEEEAKVCPWGPVLTVGLAFFIGELGDKTQLTAITLSADAQYPAWILMGTVTGMIVTGGLGIFVGKKIGNKIPEMTIKLVASSIFMFFGVTKLLETVPDKYLSPLYITLFLVVITVIAAIRIRKLLQIKSKGRVTKYERISEELFHYYKQMEHKIEGICLGENHCGSCQRNECIIGYTKSLIRQMESTEDDSPILEYQGNKISVIKNAKKDRVLEALITTIKILSHDSVKEKELYNVHKIRQNFERVLFNKRIHCFANVEDYVKAVRTMDEDLADKIANALTVKPKK